MYSFKVAPILSLLAVSITALEPSCYTLPKGSAKSVGDTVNECIKQDLRSSNESVFVIPNIYEEYTPQARFRFLQVFMPTFKANLTNVTFGVIDHLKIQERVVGKTVINNVYSIEADLISTAGKIHTEDIVIKFFALRYPLNNITLNLTDVQYKIHFILDYSRKPCVLSVLKLKLVLPRSLIEMLDLSHYGPVKTMLSYVTPTVINDLFVERLEKVLVKTLPQEYSCERYRCMTLKNYQVQNVL